MVKRKGKALRKLRHTKITSVSFTRKSLIFLLGFNVFIDINMVGLEADVFKELW